MFCSGIPVAEIIIDLHRLSSGSVVVLMTYQFYRRKENVSNATFFVARTLIFYENMVYLFITLLLSYFLIYNLSNREVGVIPEKTNIL